MKQAKHKLEVSDDFSKKVIIIMGVFLLLFTITVLVLFFFQGQEPSTLIVSVFTACLGEGSILGVLKTSKNKYKAQFTVQEPVEENDKEEPVG